MIMFSENPRRIPAVIAILLLTVFLCLFVSVDITPSSRHHDHSRHFQVNAWHQREVNWKSFSDNIEHWEPDWLNRSDYKLLLEERIKTIADRCSTIKGHLYDYKVEDQLSKRPAMKQTKIAKRIMYGDTNPKMEYCASGKTGTIFIKNVLALINKNVKPTKTSRSLRFMTVRNPWHRLVSTYRDKIRLGYLSSEVTCPYGVTRTSSKKLKSPTFPQYITCIIDYWHAGYSDVHWYPEITRCEICTTRYDYIVTTENLSNELLYIVNQTNVPQHVKDMAFRSDHHSVRSRNSFQDFWKEIPENQISELQHIYKDEIYLLGYPSTPFVDSPYA